MEQLRQDDPPWTGPYATLARVDSEREQERTPDRRYLARSADGLRTVMVCLPRSGADPTRWVVEAEGARRQSLPGFLPVTEVGGSATSPWYATPYLPRLTLPDALAAYGRPLPETAVRALGARLATALAAAHARGVTHAGLSPAAVLLGAEGPRLACFGAVRAAAPDGVDRRGAPGLDPGCLAPEQAQGGRPRPLGDIYALGAVLAYGSTGHTVPERAELPASLRPLIAACLSRDPAERPSAEQMAAELAAGSTVMGGGGEPSSGAAQSPPTGRADGPAWPVPAVPDGRVRPVPATPAAISDAPIRPVPTVLDGSPAPVPTVLDSSPAPVPTVLDGAGPALNPDEPSPFPLPAPLVAALARQSARMLALPLPRPRPHAEVS
ncbi:serine/threonine protein kinase [Streptomyces sp. NPDC085995]|uniref:serine/threonine protein kinase n=1 Tax=Streptomyces sp. NPDC085995 TaxID=3154861 RepID=UPI0034302A1B